MGGDFGRGNLQQSRESARKPCKLVTSCNMWRLKIEHKAPGSRLIGLYGKRRKAWAKLSDYS